MPSTVARLLLAALLLTLGATGCSRKLSRPDPVTPERHARWYETQADEGFSFSMPDPPEVQRQSLATEAGPLKMVMYLQVNDDLGAAFNVTTARYPEGFMEAREPAEVLAGARDGAASTISGEVIEQRDVQLFAPDGTIAPGLEIVVTTPQSFLYRGRIFIVGDQLIQISYVAPEDHDSEQQYRQFVESFILTPAAGPE